MLPSFSIRIRTRADILAPDIAILVGCAHSPKKRSCNILPYQLNCDAPPGELTSCAAASAPLPEGAAFTETFFVSVDFFSDGVTAGFGETFATRVFFGVGRGLGFGVALGEALGEDALGRGVADGGGLGVGSSRSLFAVGTIGGSSVPVCPNGGDASASATKGGSATSGSVGAGSETCETKGATSPTPPSIQRISVATGFFALALQRSTPVRTATCASPMIATLRQKLPFRGMV